MEQWKDIDLALAELLLEAVQKREFNVTYKEISERLEVRLGRQVNTHFSLSHPLGKVSTLCHSIGLPLISCIVRYSGNSNVVKVGEGFYPFACTLKPEYRQLDPTDAWRQELNLVRECKEWDKLGAYISGQTITKSSDPVTAATASDSFASWLTQTTKLAGSSIDKYARAVRTISQEMIDRKVIAKSIIDMDIFELDIAMAAIMQNTYFVDKNTRGNHMYSNALKQFRYYRSSEDAKPSSAEVYLAALKTDNTIPETERAAIVQSRIGQGQFRKQLMDKYHGSCIITGINHPKLLVASHIKPWAASDNQERLQVDNGLLLSATYDRLFDSGLITFDKTGRVYLSSFIGAENEKRLHLQQGTQYPLLITNQMKTFLEYHSDVVFVK